MYFFSSSSSSSSSRGSATIPSSTSGSIGSIGISGIGIGIGNGAANNSSHGGTNSRGSSRSNSPNTTSTLSTSETRIPDADATFVVSVKDTNQNLSKRTNSINHNSSNGSSINNGIINNNNHSIHLNNSIGGSMSHNHNIHNNHSSNDDHSESIMFENGSTIGVRSTMSSSMSSSMLPPRSPASSLKSTKQIVSISSLSSTSSSSSSSSSSSHLPSSSSSSTSTFLCSHKYMFMTLLLLVMVGLMQSFGNLTQTSSLLRALGKDTCYDCYFLPPTSTGGTGASSTGRLTAGGFFTTNANKNKEVPSWYSEAIVWTTDYLEECDAIRLYHLVATSKAKYREVWVLHNHHLFKSMSPEVKRSNELLMNIPGLKFASQLAFAPKSEIHYFEDSDERPRRAPVSAALNFIVVNNFTQTWYMEPDMFYTGDWNDIFNSPTLHPNNDIDWVASQKRFRAGNDDWWAKRDAGRLCKIQHQSCVSYNTASFAWPLSRISNKLATMLLNDLERGVVQGHHETIIGSYLKFRNLNHVMVPQDKLGMVVGVGWDKWERPIDLTVDNMSPQRSKLYHPVDCVAYTQNENKVLEEIGKWSPTGYNAMKDDPTFLQVLTVKKQIYPVPTEKALNGFRGTRLILPPTSNLPTNGKEALFWTTMVVDDCEAIRLRHLAETAKDSHRDVWVLHTHAKQIETNPTGVQRSKELIASIPGLKSAEQAPERIIPFDSEVSGTGKSSVLKMIVQERYDFGWHVENDAFFTGAWKEIFDYTRANSKHVDAMSLLTTWRSSASDWWKHEAFRSCYIGRKSCSKYSGIGFGWPVSRFSYPFAYALLSEMEEGYVQGHHEPVVPAYARLRGYVYSEFAEHLLGDVDLGNWGTLTTKHKTLEEFKPIKNKLYHPLKCKAYGTDINKLRHDVITWGAPTAPIKYNITTKTNNLRTTSA